MNIENKTVWQIGCGDEGRDYSDLCLHWGVILIGPGHAGPYPDCDEILAADGEDSGSIRRFAEEINDEDIVVLKLGMDTVYGVGQVVGTYAWRPCFGDVDGWDLQHVRRVNWLWKGRELFPARTMSRGRCQRLNVEAVKNWLRHLEVPEEKYRQVQKDLPEAGRAIEQNEIAEYLFDQGVESNSIENLMRQFDEIRRIAKWYKGTKYPSERETVTYLVVPILRALGWTPQKMAVEWKLPSQQSIDVALFDQLPRGDSNLAVVVEAKSKDSSCLSAKGQAQEYAKDKPNCQRLIVTDGLRYGTYIKTASDYRLEAYFNLTDLREKYPIYDCQGVKEALRIMTPEWRD